MKIMIIIKIHIELELKELTIYKTNSIIKYESINFGRKTQKLTKHCFKKRNIYYHREIKRI